MTSVSGSRGPLAGGRAQAEDPHVTHEAAETVSLQMRRVSRRVAETLEELQRRGALVLEENEELRVTARVTGTTEVLVQELRRWLATRAGEETVEVPATPGDALRAVCYGWVGRWWPRAAGWLRARWPVNWRVLRPETMLPAVRLPRSMRRGARDTWIRVPAEQTRTERERTMCVATGRDAGTMEGERAWQAAMDRMRGCAHPDDVGDAARLLGYVSREADALLLTEEQRNRAWELAGKLTELREELQEQDRQLY